MGMGCMSGLMCFFLGNVNLIKDGVDCIPPVVPPNMISHQKMQAARWSDAGHSLESSAVCSTGSTLPRYPWKSLKGLDILRIVG